MQLPTDTALAAAVDDRQRRPLLKVSADWGGDGLYAHAYSDLTQVVDEVEVERSLTSDLPVEAGLVDGYVTAEARVTLSGEHPAGGTVASLFAPYNTGSPLAAARLLTRELRVELGLACSDGPRLLRQFTGPLRSIAGDVANGEAKLEALDPAERLRALVTLPIGGMDRTAHLTNPRGYPFTTNSQWVVDYVLRRNGIFASPPPSADAVFSATLHGSHVAEVAAQTFVPGYTQLPGPYAGDWYLTDGHPYGMLYPRGDMNSPPVCWHLVEDQVAPTAGRGFGFTALVKCGTGFDGQGVASTAYKFLHSLEFSPTLSIRTAINGDGRLTAEVRNAGTTKTATLTLAQTGSLGWRHIGWWVQFNATTVDLHFQVAGTNYSVTGQTIGAIDLTGLYPRPRMATWFPTAWSNATAWEAAARPTGLYPGVGHVSQADVGKGANELTNLPVVAARDSWAVLQEVAAAEYGTVGHDEWGRPFFRSRAATFGDTATLERTYTTAASIKELATEVNTDTIRNVIGWTSSRAYTQRAASIAYASQDPLEFHTIPGTTSYLIPLPGDVIVPMAFDLPQYTAADWQANNGAGIVGGYVAQNNVDQTEITPAMALVFVRWSMVAPRVGQLTVVNNADGRINLRLPGADGAAALKVYGYKITSEPAVVGERVRPGSVTVYGERGYRLPDSPWRQLDAPQRAIAGAVLAVTANPLPVIEDVPVVGDPRVQLGDTVLLTDRDRLSVRASVVKINRTLSKGDGLADKVAVRPLAPPGFGVLDDPTRGQLNATLVLAP